MNAIQFIARSFESPRHKTSYLEAGPSDGSLMIFIHGWPELGLVWRAQMEYFAAAGWRCIAPDMRGYGDSSVPDTMEAYAISEIVQDMLELNHSLGGKPAVWIGHDWGSPIVWSIAANHSEQCCAAINLCIPYFARGFALDSFLPFIDREIYPADQYPMGQFDYFLYYKEQFSQAAWDFEADIAASLNVLYRHSQPADLSKPAITSTMRAQGGWFGPAHRAPDMPRDTTMLSQPDFDEFVAAFKVTGFKGANAWYMNDDANLQYAATAPNYGIIDLPVLFLHAANDTVCKTVNSRLADPMRSDCSGLTEVIIQAGHELQLERPTEVNTTIHDWLKNKGINPDDNIIKN